MEDGRSLPNATSQLYVKGFDISFSNCPQNVPKFLAKIFHMHIFNSEKIQITAPPLQPFQRGISLLGHPAKLVFNVFEWARQDV